MKFSEFGLDEQILEAIHFAGFEEATPIQEQAIPIILKNRDLIGCAQTGTGKTAAFILPVLEQIKREKPSGTSTLIIVPTRELAGQINSQIMGMAYFTDAHSETVYGGGGADDWDRERKALTNGTDIIVATPGKLIAHLQMGYVKFDSVRHLILDEADRMLDMGFYDDLMKIVSHLPKKRQNLLFSATMPPKIRKLSMDILTDPEEVSISISKTATGVKQGSYCCYDEQKESLVESIVLDRPDYNSIIIFCSRKNKVAGLVRKLQKRKFDTAGISSDYEQNEREEVLMKFRSKSIRILVATDVLSRGIDIQDISLVINFDVPNAPEDYVHRVGRTARANTKGEAITLVNPLDMRKFQRILDLVGPVIEMHPLPEEMGKGPEFRPGSKGKGNRKPNSHNKNFKKGRNHPRSDKGGNGNRPAKKNFNPDRKPRSSNGEQPNSNKAE
ncbi:DEAD/DEAH box helicase [Phaeocystidibacter marisrubri]|uniref:DEAD/DEAH box helicase n=1 Tax=Phaeocystidibacter marisrubri TaxID=1577780 RepID=A0A6L3ZFH5_9FLAO|nr:DEAD/DEAH box helicase [Phaeocystidibacter marisrubri]KAB2816631.1 DEAD/DEAH box helicase [Phaeocystidibacter marisrubri]GGH70039.1 RNA helicase [Phaeocystidibacter marisrubri]